MEHFLTTGSRRKEEKKLKMYEKIQMWSVKIQPLRGFNRPSCNTKSSGGIASELWWSIERWKNSVGQMSHCSPAFNWLRSPCVPHKLKNEASVCTGYQVGRTQRKTPLFGWQVKTRINHSGIPVRKTVCVERKEILVFWGPLPLWKLTAAYFNPNTCLFYQVPGECLKLRKTKISKMLT